jgi:outer membrane protein assembly factor BamE
MNKILTFVIILTALLGTGCSKGLFSVHKLEIQQGNALKQEDLDRLSTGMSKEEVRTLLGTPVITPLFEQDRWDYFYYLKSPDTRAEKRTVSVYFQNDAVSRIE